MRQIPKARTVPDSEKVEILIGKMYINWPLTAKMVEADAELLRKRHQIFMKAGFTDDQAFQLILRK